MRISKNFSGVDSSGVITMGPENIIALSVACSANFVGTVKIKRKLTDSSALNDAYEFTASAETIIYDVEGVLYSAEIEAGGYTSGSVVVGMRT